MAIAIKDSIEGAFGRHETFTIRYGWLKRGFDNAIADPALFYCDDAHHRLGVGKNMAKSIRFWLTATRLMVEIPDGERGRRTRMRPTYFGLSLLNGNPTVSSDRYHAGLSEAAPAFADITGFDPYLEQLSSWWLIHWMMLSPQGKLPAWWTAFNTFTPVAFTVDSLNDHVLAQIEATAAWNTPKPPSPATVRKDVLALLRAHAGTAGSRKADKVDDSIDAPMVPLSLIRESDSGFRFSVGPKPGLSPEIVAFACLDFLARTGYSARTALISTLANEVGGPGRVFKLAERDLGESLNAVARAHPDLLTVSSAASSPMLVLGSSMTMRNIATELLGRHYHSSMYMSDSGLKLSRVVSTDVVPDFEGGHDGSTDQGQGSVRAISQARLF